MSVYYNTLLEPSSLPHSSRRPLLSAKANSTQAPPARVRCGSLRCCVRLPLKAPPPPRRARFVPWHRCARCFSSMCFVRLLRSVSGGLSDVKLMATKCCGVRATSTWDAAAAASRTSSREGGKSTAFDCALWELSWFCRAAPTQRTSGAPQCHGTAGLPARAALSAPFLCQQRLRRSALASAERRPLGSSRWPASWLRRSSALRRCHAGRPVGHLAQGVGSS